MVERSLSMREVPGSIPGFSTVNFFSSVLIFSIPLLDNQIDVPESNKLDFRFSREQCHEWGSQLLSQLGEVRGIRRENLHEPHEHLHGMTHVRPQIQTLSHSYNYDLFLQF